MKKYVRLFFVLSLLGAAPSAFAHAQQIPCTSMPTAGEGQCGSGSWNPNYTAWSYSCQYMIDGEIYSMTYSYQQGGCYAWDGRIPI